MVDLNLSADGNYLIAADSGRNVYLFNRNSDLLWQQKCSGDIGLVDITDQGKYCIVAYGNLYVNILNQDGDLLRQVNLDISGKILIVWSPRNGKYLAISNRKDLYFYNILE
jgi:tricorn protease-like protein